MKQLQTFMVSLFFATTASADCTTNGLWIFPGGQTIAPNAVFVLNGYAESQNVILGLNKQYSIYLKNGDKKIALLVTEICVGQLVITQAVLQPATLLEAGVEYTLCIDSLPEYEKFGSYNYSKQEYEPLVYKVGKSKDTLKPVISGSPKAIQKIYSRPTCGHSEYVVFSNPAKDESELMVKTTVKNLQTGTITACYLKIENNRIYVGHENCFGAFNFDGSKYYEVTFSFMDASGNMTPWTGRPIKFSKPIKPEKYR